MSAPTTAEYLKYANLQIAAEAFIRNEETNALDSAGALYLRALVRGNDHSSRFVASQAEKFSGEWEVLDQRANTKTGFSGTLFRNRDTNETVLSFRSTEFIDDAARDNKATNELEIKETGFAWGQIADMQQWYAELKEDGTKLGAGQAFSVTGYSLGGHLATVFNLLNAGAAERVVTFNGAGVGLVKNGTLQDALNEFNELRISPDAVAARLTHPGLATFYRRIQAELFSGQTTAIQAQADLNALYTDANTGVTVLGSQATTLMKALKGIETLGNEAVRVTTLVAGGAENPSASPKPVQAKDIAGMDLNYRLAMLFASEHTQSASLVAGAVQGFGGKQYAGSLANQYDVVGDTSPSVVANSQWHYGQDVRVGIEDQPLYRGGIGAGILIDAIALKSPDLLVNQYAVKDFGDTHSLVLLVDSLSVQNTLLSLMPEEERSAEKVRSLLKIIYKAATNQERVDGDLLSGGSQGKAEGDLLEQLVNALADMVLGPNSHVNLKGNPDGGTWARTADKDGYSGREKFFEVIDVIKKRIDEIGLAGQFGISASNQALADSARKDFGSYLALKILSPFSLKMASASQPVQDAIGLRWGGYGDWKADKGLLDQGKSSNEMKISDLWLSDRAAMLIRKNWFNTVNKESFDLFYSAPNNSGGAASGYQLEDTFYEDLATGYKIRQGKITNATRNFIFGDGRGNALIGNGAVDHLYGDEGDDTLNGLGGADYLEGGSGADTYKFEGSFGKDTLNDHDGLGAIQMDGKTVGRGKSAGKTNTWAAELDGGQKIELTVYEDAASSTGKKLVIARVGSTADTVTINNFDLTKAQSPTGYLGIQLDPAVKVALRDSLGTNPFENYAFDPASLNGSSSIKEHGSKSFALYLNRPANAGDTITLSLSDLKDKFKAILGDVTVPADGAVITLSEGQMMVSIALVQEGAEVDASGAARITATYQEQPEPGMPQSEAQVAVSNAWGIELSDVSDTTTIKNGDQRPPIKGLGATDQVTVSNYFQADSLQDGAPADSKIDQIVFDSGEVWDQAKISAVIAAGGSTGPGNPPPSSYTYAYVLPDQNADYSLSGNGAYIFKGNSKANKLTGNDGANVINGAAGNDTLTGGKGGDTYFMEAGTGQDTIVENDSTSNVSDLLQWGSNVRHDQIWLRKAGNNLEVSVIGTSDKAIVKDWYVGSSRRVEQIWANSKVLTDAKVQSLVDAMA